MKNGLQAALRRHAMLQSFEMWRGKPAGGGYGPMLLIGMGATARGGYNVWVCAQQQGSSECSLTLSVARMPAPNRADRGSPTSQKPRRMRHPLGWLVYHMLQLG